MKQLICNAVLLAAVLGSFACSSSSSGGGSGTGSGSGSSGGSSSGTSGGTPTLAISMPTAGAMVSVTPPDDKVPVTFMTTNFTPMPVGMCGSLANTDNCGHLHVFVDDMACTPDGAPYNNDATSSPAEAILSNCPMANGSHKITLELHHDNHSPIQVNGATVSASVTITATGG